MDDEGKGLAGDKSGHEDEWDGDAFFDKLYKLSYRGYDDTEEINQKNKEEDACLRQYGLI